MTTPDTTEAVAEALLDTYTLRWDTDLARKMAATFIAAHNKALEEAGYITINRAELAATLQEISQAEIKRHRQARKEAGAWTGMPGDVPPWMSRVCRDPARCELDSHVYINTAEQDGEAT